MVTHDRVSAHPIPSGKTLLAAALVLALCATLVLAVRGDRDPAAATAPSGARAMAGDTEEPVVRHAPFRVANFNVLGYSHTAPGGSRYGKYADGVTRMTWTYDLLNRYRISVVGFQELQTKQLRRFRTLAKSSWGVYPADQLDGMAMNNSIAWRTDTWQLLEARTTPIPYFRGRLVQMPYLLMRHVPTGRLAWFANFHNPANPSDLPDQQRWRDEATRRQVALANRLRQSGIPVVFTGDFNERGKYFCRLTLGAPMQSASGGSYNSTECLPPADMIVDWIFGTLDYEFTNYAARRGYLVRRASDHALVIADGALPVSIDPPRTDPNAPAPTP